MNSLDYRGRTVVLTGAAGGIGRGLAQAFAESGATLELLDRDAAALERLVAELAPLVPARGTPLDLADHAAVESYAHDLAANNAGVEYPTPLADSGIDADRRWAALLDNNAASMQRLTHALCCRACRPAPA
jgi:NADP-dependent 3-hydroxy acid dehydrogenase YdfG